MATLGVLATGVGKSTENGSGEFHSGLGALGLSGTYKLHVGRSTARLYQGDEQVWFGTGTQEGLEGAFEIHLAPMYPE